MNIIVLTVFAVIYVVKRAHLFTYSVLRPEINFLIISKNQNLIRANQFYS